MLNCVRPILSAIFLGPLVGSLTGSLVANAAPPETAPPALVTAIAEIEAAANAQDMERVMALHSSSFENSDGFSREQYQETLNQLWTQYTTLTYDIDLIAWEAVGDAVVAETVTTVQGQQQRAGRILALTAEVRSRQRYEDGLIVFQEILTEESRLQSGITPPSVDINLPESVALGDRFAFDAIVLEPLGDRLLLGHALNEGVTPTDFLVPRPIPLQDLATGGLFKIGTASAQPDQRWISSVLIREDGLVIDTRRLRIEN
ncbi:MAG: nuclear transport factor 2 family protein [Cyanobacteria bacterium J06638_20]